jgi:acyl-CoA thioesterase II
VYFVDRLRDGSSFTTRRVTAIQHGQAIFNLSASFHIAEPGLEHQAAMPDVPPPEGLAPELDLIREMAARIPETLRPVLTQERPIDFRPVTPVDPFDPAPRPPERFVWFRALGSLPEDPMIHQAVLAYASDYGLLPTALQPHGLSFRSPGMQLASLDHSLWMHRPFRADEWLLYCMDSTVASGARGFVRGSIYSRDGSLVASVAQEGLLRVRKT